MAVILVAAYLINLVWPMKIHTGTVQLLVGLGIDILATALLLWCFGLFTTKRTTILPRRPVNQLVLTGPYQFSRNPMYVSLTLYHLGIAIGTGNLWQAIGFPVFILALRRWVIQPEESYLLQRFGTEYREYCSQVRRWL